MSRIRGIAAATALLGPLLLSGCGIKPTGVVESGAAAKVAVAAPARTSMAYFVTPEGRLAPSPQPEHTRDGPRGSLRGLLGGPGGAEAEAGLGTRLPPVEEKELEAIGVGFTARDRLEVRLPFPVAGLDPLAHRQLVCSALSTLDPVFEVVLRGSDTELEAARCAAGG
ncbi:hypothetical protein [Streptomyces sp. NBC_00091]|uniref:hypothetical protein n=1 Tax=Streptomyces sp. NBC_00091 TaxID=2975648 RepID=UPI00224D0F10|nr:hypothetical protein [Streptomyces sp. NBC_00091]MCX5375001.1 hypothetical protein [Streptomyces sp. NBC_00091]